MPPLAAGTNLHNVRNAQSLIRVLLHLVVEELQLHACLTEEFLAFGTGVLLSGKPLKTAVQSGFCFCQIGEFSFIIAGLGLSYGVIDENLYPIIVSVSILTTFVTPYMIKGANPFYNWVRGHMARRQDMKWSEQAIKESDYFTNICPQNDVMNNGVWHQIENLVRRVATQYDSVHVICGPIFTDNANGYIGPNRLPVPDYFFKTLLVKDATGYHAIAFLCPNNDKTLTMKEAACTVDKVEAMSKIDVYSYLPDQTESTIESTFNTRLWGL